MRGGFGAPMSLKRPGPNSGQPFELYLSSMLSDAMVGAGSNVTIVPIAKGTSINEAIQQSSIASNTESIILLMYDSRYDAGFSAEYNHNFDVFVVNKDGEVDGLDVDPFVAAVVGGAQVAVPEPQTLLLALVAGLTLLGARRRR